MLTNKKLESKNDIYDKIIFCSGKIRYDLEQARRSKNLEGKILLVSIEQLYPFPHAEIEKIISRNETEKYLWCQEEPKNQGPWKYIKDRFELYFSPNLFIENAGSLKKNTHLYCISRPERAAPDGGNFLIFEKEQKEIINEAINL